MPLSRLTFAHGMARVIVASRVQVDMIADKLNQLVSGKCSFPLDKEGCFSKLSANTARSVLPRCILKAIIWVEQSPKSKSKCGCRGNDPSAHDQSA